MNTVIFACVHNAGRSQMAAAWFNALVAPGTARAISAGTEPATHLHAQVAMVMREVGIDLSSKRPQLLTPAMLAEASDLITMGCGEQCPVAPPHVRRDDWPLDDPQYQPLERVREVRDDIRDRVLALIRERGWEAAD